jgi:cyclopropane-fatty-acyl-phospholipid synthase
LNPFDEQLHDNKATIDTFIDRYVFPGGYLPTINILLESLQKGSRGSLEVTSVQDIGPHYGKTLLVWRDNFLRNWEVIKSDFIAHQRDASNADVEAFRRKWLVRFCNSFNTSVENLSDNIILTIVDI